MLQYEAKPSQSNSVMCVLQVYPIRVATCNLHGKNNKAGITALVPKFNIKQFILSLPPNQEPLTTQEIWLEAGGFGFGPLTVDAAMALPSPEFHAIQDAFLKLHDKKTHRLYFLWPPDMSQMSPKVVGKCGCQGGCCFFGRNRNGLKFFSPTDQDFTDSYSTAVYHIITKGSDLGYGQSLLQRDQLVFDIQGSTLPASPTKSKMMSKRASKTESKTSLETSTTLVDDNASNRQSSILSSISDRSLDGARQTEMSISGSDRTLKDSMSQKAGSSDPQDRETSVETSSIPSEYMPETAMPDAYDTDRYVSTPSDTGMTWASGGSGSVTSLPETVGLRRKPFGHERKLSYDNRNRARMSENGQPLIGSPTSFTTGSKSSIPSSGGYDIKSGSRQSSLTSPVLRRLSSQFSVHNEGSLASMSTASERFFSAAEDMVTSGEDLSSPPYHTLSSSSDPASMMSAESPTTFLQSTVIQRKNSSSSDSAASFISAMTSASSHRDLTKAPSQPDILKDVRASNVDDDQQTSTTIDADDATNTTFDQDELDEMELQNGDPNMSVNYVDLHGQINQQITKSPLLMSCYTNHMTQLQCSHWSSPPPLPHLVNKTRTIPSDPSFSSRISASLTSEQTLTPAWIPHFSYKREGFGPSLMVDKRDMRPPTLSSSSPSDYDKSQRSVFKDQLEEGTFYSTKSVLGYNL